MQDPPYGYCHCGCGEKTNLAIQNHKALGHVKGEPYKFVKGHVRRKDLSHREEDRGYETPCHIWQLTHNRAGYGIQSRWKDYSRLAYKAIWERQNGRVPEGMELDHLCRVRGCVNPEHLEVVTPAENLRRGLKTKLNARQVRQIRKLCESGRWMRKEVARAYGVDARTVSQIVLRQNWRDIA